MIQVPISTPYWLAGLVATLSIGGCSSSNTASTAVNELAASSVSILPGEQPSQNQKDKMLSAKDALFTQLSGRLIETMGSAGPIAAISVCEREAPKIAKSVSTEHGLQIGRTGVRLRNVENKPPAWADELIASRTDTPTFATLSNGHVAALLPIKLQAQCLMCHGPKEQIAADIQAQLAKHYPNDEATGFQDGELRGWFWVEMENN